MGSCFFHKNSTNQVGIRKINLSFFSNIRLYKILDIISYIYLSITTLQPMKNQLLVLLTPQIPPYLLNLLMSSKNGTWRWRSGSLPRNNVGGTTGMFPFSRLPYFSLALLYSLITAVNNNHINKNQTTLILRVNNLLAAILLNRRVKSTYTKTVHYLRYNWMIYCG